jgi:hypothetical protein
MIRSLYGRLALVFALLTLACGGFTAWLYQDMAAATSRKCCNACPGTWRATSPAIPIW